MFVHRIRKYIGSYLVQLKGKVDAIVMSAGVGENSPDVRNLVLQNLEVTTHDPVLYTCTAVDIADAPYAPTMQALTLLLIFVAHTFCSLGSFH